MERAEAKKLAQTVTASDLKQMLVNARNGIKDWKKVSTVNIGLTKGTAFNILSKGTIHDKTPFISKVNMLREFGELLPGYVKPEKKKAVSITPVHQEPRDLENI